MANHGIDYGLGRTNRDPETGIRYGIINANHVEWWWDSAEAEYPTPICEECEGDLVPSSNSDDEEAYKDFFCPTCKLSWWSDAFDCQEASWVLKDDNGTEAFSDDHGDIWVTKSRFFTRGGFCSPCAPGAVSLQNWTTDEDAPRAYCLPTDYFGDEVPCPYPVWSVATGELLYTPLSRKEE